MSTQPIYAIKDKAPEFPCWLYCPPCIGYNGIQLSEYWYRIDSIERWMFDQKFGPKPTHWHPDAPTAPTSRPQAEVPTREEAEEIAMRFINGHFGNPGRRPLCSIPADPKRDDDIRLLAFIRHAPACAAASSGGPSDADGDAGLQFMELRCANVGLAQALKRVVEANAALAEIKDGLTYYERSPSKESECFRRWAELNDALAEARAAMQSTRQGGQS